MDIDHEAPVQARHEIIVDAPAATAWRLLTEIDSWPQWNPAIARSKLNGPIQEGTSFAWKAGGVSLVSTLQDVVPEQRISWTGKTLGLHAVHTWNLRPTTTGVAVETSKSFAGWLASLLPGMLQKTLDKTLQNWLRDLKQAAEGSV